MLRLPLSTDLSALQPRFATCRLHNELQIAGRTLRFPNIVTGANLEPAQWLLRQHETMPVHEPGLVTWLYNLGEALKDEQVAVFDIGAAYGYFSLLSALFFPLAEICAVEPNQPLAHYIATAARHNDIRNVHVINRLVCNRIGNAKLKARNFVFLPEHVPAPDIFTDVDVTMTTLEDLLTHAGSARPILKIDVEGWQARILPPAIDQLAVRSCVILLECDRPEKLSRFGATNAGLADPFLKRGYRLFFSDHRDIAFELREIFAAGDLPERDALLAMIPPDIPISSR